MRIPEIRGGRGVEHPVYASPSIPGMELSVSGAMAYGRCGNSAAKADIDVLLPIKGDKAGKTEAPATAKRQRA
jgi:hypothetical protein